MRDVRLGSLIKEASVEQLFARWPWPAPRMKRTEGSSSERIDRLLVGPQTAKELPFMKIAIAVLLLAVGAGVAMAQTSITTTTTPTSRAPGATETPATGPATGTSPPRVKGNVPPATPGGAADPKTSGPDPAPPSPDNPASPDTQSP